MAQRILLDSSVYVGPGARDRVDVYVHWIQDEGYRLLIDDPRWTQPEARFYRSKKAALSAARRYLKSIGG
jgi:hypothetical protein